MSKLGAKMWAHPFGRKLLGVIQPPLFVAKTGLVAKIDPPRPAPGLRPNQGEVQEPKVFVPVSRYSESDALSIEQSFVDGQYDLPDGAHGVFIDRLFQEIVASGLKPLIVDCGANIGTSEAWFSARFPEAHIVASSLRRTILSCSK
jgi:hypothetical protein